MRTTISLPKDVKDRMKSFPEANWSAIAVRAFREYMKEDVEPTFSELVAEVRELRRILESLEKD